MRALPSRDIGVGFGFSLGIQVPPMPSCYCHALHGPGVHRCNDEIVCGAPPARSIIACFARSLQPHIPFCCSSYVFALPFVLRRSRVGGTPVTRLFTSSRGRAFQWAARHYLFCLCRYACQPVDMLAFVLAEVLLCNSACESASHPHIVLYNCGCGCGVRTLHVIQHEGLALFRP